MSVYLCVERSILLCRYLILGGAMNFLLLRDGAALLSMCVRLSDTTPARFPHESIRV